MLARRLDAAYRKRVEHAQTQEQVRQATLDPDPEEGLLPSLFERMMGTPPEQLTWEALERHAADEPEACAAKWKELRALARTELGVGVQLVEALGKDTPWERARLLAVRDAFIEEWRPRGGIELALVDQAVLTYYWWLDWQERANRLGIEADQMERPLERVLEGAMEKGMPGQYGLPRFEAVRRKEGEAAQTADRYQRAFMRVVRALRDLRRYAGSIHIHNEGQMNIGPQQVNIDRDNGTTRWTSTRREQEQPPD